MVACLRKIILMKAGKQGLPYKCIWTLFDTCKPYINILKSILSFFF